LRSASIRAASSTMGPLHVFTSRADGLIKPNSHPPTRPRVRLLRTRWIVRISACRNNSCLETQRAPRSCAFSGSRFSLHATTSIPKARAIRATSDPMLPRPRIPRILPRMPSPIVRCQPPERTDAVSMMRFRALARMREQSQFYRRAGVIPVCTTSIL
jgi:hypothetical protein